MRSLALPSRPLRSGPGLPSGSRRVRRHPFPTFLALPALLAVVAGCTGDTGDTGNDDVAPRDALGTGEGAPTAVADATAVNDARAALPDSTEAVSLLGGPLYAPTLPEETRQRLEQNLIEAEAELQAAPGSADALIWVGRRLAYLGRYRDAIEVYTRALELHPEDARLYRHRGHRWITVREFDRAIADFRRAVELIEGTEDEVEPDGAPNALGIPTSTLHFNIWYHLGLAHYLKGELEQAVVAYNSCMEVSKHPDSVVATSYWLNNALRRLGMDDRAERVVAGIDADMEIIESTAYLDVLLLWKGERSLEEITGGGADSGADSGAEAPGSGDPALESVTTAYGVGNWHFVNGRRDEAYGIWEDILEREGQWAAFGYIAAEAEIADLEEGAGDA